MRHSAHAFALALAGLLLGGCAGRYFQPADVPPPAPRYTLQSLPQKEIWTGIIFNGAKVGFSRLRVTPHADAGRYLVETETSLRLKLLAFDKRIVLRSSDVVEQDLTLVAFRYYHHIDGNDLRLTGKVAGRELVVDRVTGSSASPQRLPIDGKVYPAAALALHPVIAGLRVGEERRLTVYASELQRLAEAVQSVEAWETSSLFEGPAFKVTTRMLGLASTAWIDVKGRPLLERGLNGVIISALEDERTARGYLAAAALNQDEALVQWSLIKPDQAITDARGLRTLSLALSKNGASSPLSDERQRCRDAGSEWLCDIDASATRAGAASVANPRHLRPSFTVPSYDTEIVRLARRIAPPSLGEENRVKAILAWLGENIRKEAADVFTARDVLDTGRAECQGHAYLFAALARVAGIPTRVMNGLVYSEEMGGFLYHSWTESLIDGQWRAVDPTFGQAVADATHLALAEGEESADLLPLSHWVGKTAIRVLATAH